MKNYFVLFVLAVLAVFAIGCDDDSLNPEPCNIGVFTADKHILFERMAPEMCTDYKFKVHSQNWILGPSGTIGCAADDSVTVRRVDGEPQSILIDVNWGSCDKMPAGPYKMTYDLEYEGFKIEIGGETYWEGRGLLYGAASRFEPYFNIEKNLPWTNRTGYSITFNP